MVIPAEILHYEPGYYPCVWDYYCYVLSMLRDIIKSVQMDADILFLEDAKYPIRRPSIRLYMNFEHTLVKQYDGNPGYRVGTIDCESDNSKYLIRIDHFTLNSYDIVIDYSLPNLHNIHTSGLFEYIYKKMVYIAPSIYRYNSMPLNTARPYDTMTSFFDTTIPRRAELLSSIDERVNKSHLNVFDCFDKDTLQRIYKNTKIMINIHQTDSHHTFEELRVLPALQSGVIVISESSPLTELIPYSDYVIWCPYDQIIDKANEVLNNYESFRSEIFDQPKRIGLNDMNDLNRRALRDKVLSWAQSH